ncbi:MAG TPA: glycosyltransferase [Chthoniobacterales bacterium]|jgi:glycosyltransferase involved in cell wall biosynthesis|nr:glycosyltransferase [Chthoniobacterales bacterium]
MKLLRSIHTLNPAVGGPIESIRQSSRALSHRGHSVEIVCLDGPADPWVKEAPVPVHALGPGRGSYGYARGFSDWIRRAHSEFDAVVVHGLWQFSSFGVWRALAGTATPYFVFPHGMLDPWFKRTYPAKHFKKLLYWPWAEYRVLRDAAAVMFTSEEERRLARESFSLYSCNEVVVNYGTATPDFDRDSARKEFLDRFPHLRGKRLLVFLGRLHEKKGCDLLVEAFNRVPPSMRENVHLVMAGPAANESYLAHLRAQAGAAGHGPEAAFTFTGMLTGQLKWGALSAAEAFILPSHQENFGIAVVEAMACGIPVLISNKVNIWREIVEDKAGLADGDDAAGVARLLSRWLAMPQQDRVEMGNNARRSFQERFTIDRATDSLLAVLRRFTTAQ